MKTIEIPADKNVCVHLLFAAVALRRSVEIFDGFSQHKVQDIERILNWIDENDVAHLQFETFDQRRILTINPTDEPFPDLTTASFSRASIDLAGTILLRDGKVRCVELGGCQFTKRPIDRHVDLLVALGGRTDDDEIYHLNKFWFDDDDDETFEFDCRTKSGVPSVGVTIHAVLSCCALPSNVECRLNSIALELSVQKVIELAKQTRPIIVNSVERTIFFPRWSNKTDSPTKLVVEHLPIDQIYLFTISSICAMFRLKVIVSNFETDRFLTEYLKTFVTITLNDDQTSALIDGTMSFIDSSNEKRRLICDVYPDGLPTDISPILTSLFIARRISFELIDRIYDVRNGQCRQFRNLGFDLFAEGNRIVFDAEKHRENSLKIVQTDFYAPDIRSGVSIFLLLLHFVNFHSFDVEQQFEIHQYEQIERGYGTSLHEQLVHLGFDVDFRRL